MTSSFQSRTGNAPEEGIKAPVVVATRAPITLSGEQTIVSTAVVEGDRVLVRAQADATENGIYNASGGAWTRAVDWNAANDVANGILVVDSSITRGIYQVAFTGVYEPDVTEVAFDDYLRSIIYTVTSASTTAVTRDGYAVDTSVEILTITLPATPSEGDIVSIDFGVRYRGFYGDAAITLAIGKIAETKADLLKVTRESLYKGIEQARVGNRINDISAAVQTHVEKHGYSVVKQFVGHGIGSDLHEGPEVPNYTIEKKRTPKIMAGMVLAIEPMVNLGTFEVRVLKDGWTVVSKDKSPSAHFEHSVAVTEEGPLILSDDIG